MHSTEVQGQEEALALGLVVSLWNEQPDFIAKWIGAKQAHSDLPKLRGREGRASSQVGKQTQETRLSDSPFNHQTGTPLLNRKSCPHSATRSSSKKNN